MNWNERVARALETLSPTANTSIAPTTIDGGWDTVTLPADTVYVDFSLTGVACRVVCANSAPTTGRGCIYYPGIVYRIPARGMAKVYAERITATGGTINVTAYQKSTADV